MANHKYSPEFKREAVSLVRDQGLTISKAAADLGMSQTTIQRWVSQAKADDGETPKLTTDEKAELARLRKEVRVLTEEREILKKAAAWFAKESDRR
jgi:transposase